MKYHINKIVLDSKSKEILDSCKGLVEATSEEYSYLFFRLKDLGYKIEQVNVIHHFEIGTYHDHSVCINIAYMKVNDIVIGFYRPTSKIVNYYMIDDWIDFELKMKYIENVSNITNLFYKLNIRTDPNYIKEYSLKYLKSEYEYKKEQLNKCIKK